MARASVIKRTVVVVVAALPVMAIVVITLRSRGGSVRLEELAELIDRADRVVVCEEPWDGSPVLFQSSDRRDLEALKASLHVELPDEFVHCMCYGTPAILLYAGGEMIGQVTNHHARLIRSSLWKSDVRLADVESFLKWFDERNVPAPRKDYEEALEQDREWQENERKWVDAMPTALKPLWAASKDGHDPPDIEPLRVALLEQIPEEGTRILALFSWYGSGAGPWSGFPSYESIAEKMLLEYPTGELLAVAEGQELTETQTEGVARLFGGFTFSQQRPTDLRLLSPDLKARLLEHSLVGADEDKRGRARRAFGGR